MANIYWLLRTEIVTNTLRLERFGRAKCAIFKKKGEKKKKDKKIKS